MGHRRHNSCRRWVEALSRNLPESNRASASHESANMILRIFVTVFFFGFAILLGILGVMRGLRLHPGVLTGSAVSCSPLNWVHSSSLQSTWPASKRAQSTDPAEQGIASGRESCSFFYSRRRGRLSEHHRQAGG